jgi:acetyl esterase/lipase
VIRVLLGIALVVVALVASYRFYALEIFNALVPKDAGSRRIARDVAFGDDPSLKLDAYAPTQGQGPWPVVVFVHGGSWSSGYKDPYEFVGRALAAQGFLTLVPNYRLHPENRFPVFVEDTARAIDWATRHAGEFGGDQRSIFLTGHSAGAYNVALAVLDQHYLASLGTDTTAIRGVALMAAPLDFLPLDSPISIDVFGQVRNLRETQPVNFVRAGAPPFLLLHGADDTTCLPRNSINLSQKLNEAGAKAQLKVYPGVGHVGILLAMARPVRGVSTSLSDVTDFFWSLQRLR